MIWPTLIEVEIPGIFWFLNSYCQQGFVALPFFDDASILSCTSRVRLSHLAVNLWSSGSLSSQPKILWRLDIDFFQGLRKWTICLRPKFLKAGMAISNFRTPVSNTTNPCFLVSLRVWWVEQPTFARDFRWPGIAGQGSDGCEFLCKILCWNKLISYSTSLSAYEMQSRGTPKVAIAIASVHHNYKWVSTARWFYYRLHGSMASQGRHLGMKNSFFDPIPEEQSLRRPSAQTIEKLRTMPLVWFSSKPCLGLVSAIVNPPWFCLEW
jgi:hypothetical protein